MGTAKSTENLSKSPSNNRTVGKDGEALARTFLKSKGFRITEENYRCPFGEIDIIALDGGEVVFIEVKSRRTTAFGNPEESVNQKKMRKLSQVALHYLSDRGLQDREARFDVVAVLIEPGGSRIHHIPRAFDLSP